MTQTPRVTDAGRWMPTRPTATLLAVGLAVIATVIAAVGVTQYQWTHLQRFYVRAYVTSSLAIRFKLPARAYQQVRLHAKGQQYFAGSDDVTVDDQDRIVLTPTALAAGVERVSSASVVVPNQEMQRLLRAYIYDGHGLLWHARGPAVVGVLALVAVLVWSIPTDVRRARARRHGAHLRGSELTSISELNRRIREA